MTKAKKQNAGNNEFLKNVKFWFNAPIYKMALDLVNGPDGPEAGESAMRAYLTTKVCKTLDL